MEPNESPLSDAESLLRDAALEYHRSPTRGKISVAPTKPLMNQRDLSLAYSPGVAYPCLDIEADPSTAAEYTSRGNLVGVVTNGTAVLGLGDIGPQTAAQLAAQLKAAGTIVWNGPVGVFEFDAFAKGTETVARAIAASPAFSIAGGGDTLAAIAKYGIEGDIGYISTGGGAFLEVLEGKTLPAFEILARRAAG